MPSKLLPLLKVREQSRPPEPLGDEVVFYSPVRDYHGRADVAHILSTIGTVLDQIDVQSELAADREIATVITACYGGHRMSGVLHESYDVAGRVSHATLLLRPLSTLREAITGMVTALEHSPLPSRAGYAHNSPASNDHS